MTDHFARPERAATSPEERVAELHRLCDEDYASTAPLRQQSAAWPVRPVGIRTAAVPTDLDVAIAVAQRLVAHDNPLTLREALRMLLRALGAEPTTRPATDDAPPPVLATPTAPGCGAVSTTRIEGYTSSEDRAHGSLDLAVYACDEHAYEARTQWLAGFTTHSSPSYMAYCGQRYDYRLPDGGR
ncbi:hypothetical protein [Streptomyces sp. SudanB91_2054]|uniref:hypothetical protein n=1 Tax=Streptomyces sp. SudanB91_2054 TaxID=3035278 RepID=UPI0036DAABC5